MEKWRLHGEVYGRKYDMQLEFLGKERVSVPDDILEQHLRNANRVSDPVYRKLVATHEQARFRGDENVEVLIAPRYVGSLGNNDDGKGNTVCSLCVNGEYVALALYNETKKEIVAIEY